MNNIFLKDIEFYKRELDPIRQYVEQSAYYISKIKNIPVEEASVLIEAKIKDKSFEGIKDPMVQYYDRPSGEDREMAFMPLSQFLRTINSEKLVTAPSLTCYSNSEENPSILSGFTDNNIVRRNTSKKEAARQKTLGNLEAHRFFNSQQENFKLYNNALSGAFSSAGSIVRNPSAHSSLTSTTRTMTSIGNASNERLISGNRHYRNAKITLNNLVLLAQSADVEEIRLTNSKFGLTIPSVSDVLNCVKHSTKFYWEDLQGWSKIVQFANLLSPEERCSVVYTGDYYHLRILNEEVIRTFICQMSQKVTGVVVENPMEVIHKTDEMYVNYAHHICLSEVTGIGKDYTLLTEEQLNVLAATCLNLQRVLIEYQDLIRTYFLTRNLPPSVAYVRESMRRTVVLSDTDSTMFSCDEWVVWYFGELLFIPEAYAVSGSVMFMATQCIAHSLALYSANLNVERKKLFMASMKPEYVFPIFGLTSVAKHYYTYVYIKEGAVYKKLETEIKGVHLKSSASPKFITDDAKKMMESILTTVMEGKKISLSYWLKHVADLEREIKRSVLAGETMFLGRLNIKTAAAYNGPVEQTNYYRSHVFWNETFGHTYGMVKEPPYTTVKFPTVLSSKRILALWLTNISDTSLRDNLDKHIAKTGRKDINVIYVSQDYIEQHGLPKEIRSVVDAESLVIEHLKSHRLVLESIGFFAHDGLNLSQMGY